MVAVRTSKKIGLSPADLERIRDTLAAGRKPKVMFTEAAGQIAGQVGQVVALTDPQLSDEWLVVRFGRDELPFSPTDLAIAPKTATARRAGASSLPNPREESPLSPPHAPTTPTPAARTSAPADRPADPPPPAPADKPASDKPASDKPAAEKTAAEKTAAEKTVEKPADKPADRPAEKAARKPARSRPAPSLTVTLGYADGEWTVSAAQGTKVIAKPCSVRPAEALKMVTLLDVPGVQEAVEEIVAAARAEAQAQAERLRAELAAIEAKLAELRDDA